MNNLYAFIWIVFGLFSCSDNSKEPQVIIQTGYGDIKVELYPTQAPKTVASFLVYVDSGLYKDASFYRVLKNENVPEEYNTGLIQGGISLTNSARQQALKGTMHESPKLTRMTHESGTISMARTTAGSATSEFFICIGDQKQFDSSSRGNSDGLGYAAFGRVIEGMDVVMKIQNSRSEGDRFIKQIKIDNIVRD